MQTPYPCLCGATPVVLERGDMATRWKVMCPVAGDQSRLRHMRGKREHCTSTAGRTPAIAIGVWNHRLRDRPTADPVREPGCPRCGLHGDHRCLDLLNFAESRNERIPTSARVRLGGGEK